MKQEERAINYLESNIGNGYKYTDKDPVFTGDYIVNLLKGFLQEETQIKFLLPQVSEETRNKIGEIIENELLTYNDGRNFEVNKPIQQAITAYLKTQPKSVIEQDIEKVNEYALFCVTCDRKNLPLLSYQDYLKHLIEQQRKIK